MSSTIRAIARVQVTVEVETGAWGKECTMEQVHQQAGHSGAQMVRQAMSGKSLDPTPFRIIGEPKVTAIITES